MELKIKSYSFYKFKKNYEFKQAIDLWFNNNKKALKIYGDIRLWNTITVTDMSYLFNKQDEFNQLDFQ